MDAPSIAFMNVPMFILDANRRRVSSPGDIDIEAQSIANTHAPFVLPVTPEPVRIAPAPKHTPYDTTNPIDDFFGVTRPRATRRSQHDSVASSLGPGGELAPPPYADPQLPAYSPDPNTEPSTLAMYLFKFGFLFPPLWIVGATIVVSPLTAPEDFEPSKSGTDRQRMAQIIRNAELKWAQRCAWAVFAFLVVGGGIAATAVGILYA